MDWSDINKIKTLYVARLADLKEVVENEYHVCAEAMADKERDYLVAKAKVTSSLKIDGVQATLIPTMVKGNSGVADLRFKFKIAESMFHGCRENIKRLHASIDAYRSLLSTAKSEINIR